MVRSAIVAALFSCLISGSALAQSSNTTCRAFGQAVHCTTIAPTPPPEPQGGADISGFSALRAALANRRTARDEQQPSAQLADISTGNGYYSSCVPGGHYTIQDAVCIGWIAGFVDHDSIYQAKVYCLPDGAQFVQLRDVLLNFLRDNADSRHRPTGMLAMVAYAKTFPCPATNLAK